MKPIDTDLTPPQFLNDLNATSQMATYTAKLIDILNYIVKYSMSAKVVTSAPAAGEVHTEGDGLGNILSEIVILDDATQTDRKLYYKEVGGNLRLIDSA